MNDEQLLEEVTSVFEALEQSAWVDWGAWNPSALEPIPLRLQVADFESNYLEQNAPLETPALQVQRALGRFLGR
jgi:hypothetical protein